MVMQHDPEATRDRQSSSLRTGYREFSGPRAAVTRRRGDTGWKRLRRPHQGQGRRCGPARNRDRSRTPPRYRSIRGPPPRIQVVSGICRSSPPALCQGHRGRILRPLPRPVLGGLLDGESRCLRRTCLRPSGAAGRRHPGTGQGTVGTYARKPMAGSVRDPRRSRSGVRRACPPGEIRSPARGGVRRSGSTLFDDRSFVSRPHAGVARAHGPSACEPRRLTADRSGPVLAPRGSRITSHLQARCIPRLDLGREFPATGHRRQDSYPQLSPWYLPLCPPLDTQHLACHELLDYKFWC